MKHDAYSQRLLAQAQAIAAAQCTPNLNPFLSGLAHGSTSSLAWLWLSIMSLRTSCHSSSTTLTAVKLLRQLRHRGTRVIWTVRAWPATKATGENASMATPCNTQAHVHVG